MSYIVDTCVIVRLGQGRAKISGKAKDLLEKRSGLFASALTIYEINALYDKNKINSSQTPKDFIDNVAQEYKIDFLPYGYSDAIRTGQLPYFHKDPFDRMIISQAVNNNFALITPDSEIEKYKIRIIW